MFSSHNSNGNDIIPMDDLEEIVVTPKYSSLNTHPDSDHEDSEDGSDIEDGGERALLDSAGGTRSRSRERYSTKGGHLWHHIKIIAFETTPSLLFATVGAIFTGELMEKAPHWRAMSQIDGLIVIIPVILNLKGNLEMNLSARLGTAANMGQLDNHDVRRSIVIGNLCLLQVQALVVSFVATCVAFLIGLIVPNQPQPSSAPTEPARRSTPIPRSTTAARKLIRPHPSPNREATLPGLVEFLMVATTSMTSACISSIILGSIMCAIVILCRKYGRDPDNIAPPVASCLGDLITLCLLGIVSTLYMYFARIPALLVVILFLLIAAGSGWTYATLQNPHVKPLLKQGWSPLIGAMAISSGTGLVLDIFVSRYMDFGLLAVAISSLPGGVGSVFISRLSTALHAAASSLPSLSIPKWTDGQSRPTPRLVMIILFSVTFPIVIAYLAILRNVGWVTVPILFACFFVAFFCLAVVSSLFIARGLTNFLWSKDLDPDMYALPVHSAFMDLFGQLLLVGCFELVALLGGRIRS